MRSVYLKPGMTNLPNRTDYIRRLAGHLFARMKELEEIGLTAEANLSEGRISVRFSRRDNAQAADWLKQKRRIETEYNPETNLIGMQVTGAITFEDLDYVQGAVMELLI